MFCMVVIFWRGLVFGCMHVRTRARLQFELEWGVNARGTWDLDGQFLSFSRDFALGWGGKRLFAAKLTQKQNEVSYCFSFEKIVVCSQPVVCFVFRPA